MTVKNRVITATFAAAGLAGLLGAAAQPAAAAPELLAAGRSALTELVTSRAHLTSPRQRWCPRRHCECTARRSASGANEARHIVRTSPSP